MGKLVLGVAAILFGVAFGLAATVEHLVVPSRTVSDHPTLTVAQARHQCALSIRDMSKYDDPENGPWIAHVHLTGRNPYTFQGTATRTDQSLPLWRRFNQVDCEVTRDGTSVGSTGHWERGMRP